MWVLNVGLNKWMHHLWNLQALRYNELLQKERLRLEVVQLGLYVEDVKLLRSHLIFHFWQLSLIKRSHHRHHWESSGYLLLEASGNLLLFNS